MERPAVTLVGAGAVATALGCALRRGGFRIPSVYSRTASSADTLARAVGARSTTCIDDIGADADIYFTCLTDDALLNLVPRIVAAGRRDALFVHTAGSIPLSVWQPHARRGGVLYPLQTFSRTTTAAPSLPNVSLSDYPLPDVPFFLEASLPDDLQLLHRVAEALSPRVYDATGEQRRYLHLAAVFACNFSNHLYHIADQLLRRHNLPFEALLPLIDETARKVHRLSPAEAQTGPAARGDRSVVDSQLALLADLPEWQTLYRLLSEEICTK
jgi:predicted short-subunit dehydrogenase-like oxidoreductase (DUF2520 family)